MRSNTAKILLTLLLLWVNMLGLSPDAFCSPPFDSKTDGYTRFRNISSKDGLSSDLVLDIIQDKYNIMWFATANGLTRYDGQKFIVYQHQQESELSLSNNLVSSLAEDIFGNLWVGTLNGLNRYDRKANNFVRYTSQPLNNKGLVDGRILALHADKNGCLWVKSKGNYLSRFDIQAETWTHYNIPAREFEGEYYYNHITEDSLGSLWISGRNIATIVLKQENGGNFTLEEVLFAPGIATFETSCAIEVGKKIYFANYNGQLLCLNPQSKRIEYVTEGAPSARAGICDKNGKLWIGGSLGIRVIDIHNQKKTIFSNNPTNSYSLASNNIHCIYKDRNDGIWIGTDKGISFYSEGLNTIRHYRGISGLEQDLSSNDITALLQDSDGLLWVGTAENGVDTMTLANEEFGNLTYNLLRHDISKATFDREKETLKQYFRHKYIIPVDGETAEQNVFGTFQNFQHSNLRFSNTNENKVSALYEDSNGNIYVGLWSHVGFNIYDKKQKVFKRHALWSKAADNSYPRIFEGNPFGANWYSGFLEDNNGNFWCATWEGFGLNLFDREKGSFAPKHYMPGHLPPKEVVKLAYDPKRERIIIAGAYYYSFYDIKSTKYNRYAEKIPDNYPNRTIFESYLKFCDAKFVELPLGFTITDYIRQDNVVWLALSNLLVKHDLTSDSFETLAKFEHGWNILAESANKQSIWIGAKSMLLKIDLKNNKIHTVTKIADRLITSLYEDSSGVVWVGTDNGLFFYDTKKNLLSSEEMNFTAVRTIVSIGQSIYIGCAEGVIQLENQKVVRQYPFNHSETKGIPGTEIYSILPASNDKIWICTNGGLVSIDQKTDKISVFTHNPQDRFSLLANNVYSVCEDGDSNLWISTTKGLCLLEHKTGLFIDQSMPDDRTLTSRLTSCILQDATGNIWAGTTENGVSVLNPQTDRLRHYIHYEWDLKSISDNYINCIFEDSRHNIWIGTRKGLNRHNQTDNNMDRIDGLGDIRIMNIQEDDSGNIWCSTSKGLLCLNPDGNVIRRILDFPGMQDNEFSKAGCKLNNGLLAFGGKYGFNIFNPTLLTMHIASKPLVLSHFTIKDSLRYFDLNEKAGIELAYSDNSFAVSFTSTDYEYGDLLKYRYKLEGFDQDWIYTAPPALAAKYTNIPFGSYTFMVEVSDCFGQWQDEKFELKIHIITPWYWQWWFILLLVALIAGIILLIIRIRESQLKKDNIRLENIVSQRTKELKEANDSKNKFFSIISHDLRNPLKALNLTTRALHEQYEDLDETERQRIIQIIHESVDQTGSLLENLLFWVVSQMSLLKPNLQKTHLSALADLNIEVSALAAKKKGVNIINAIPEDINVWADANLLSTIFRNLISNAIHFSFAESDIVISAQEKNNIVEISVSDQGIGMKEEDMKHLFRLDAKIRTRGTDDEQGTGLGLIVTQEFVHLQNGEIWVKSIENKGSIFTFTLKKYEEP